MDDILVERFIAIGRKFPDPLEEQSGRQTGKDEQEVFHAVHTKIGNPPEAGGPYWAFFATFIGMKPARKTALSEVDGVSPPAPVNPDAAGTIRQLRRSRPQPEALAQAILKGDKTALSRGITLVESTQETHRSDADRLLELCLPHSDRSVRIGITGVPGVGKSTFIEAFGSYLTSIGNKVAVLAVDPSSTVSHGSILADKTRMEELVKDPNAFIRPSASGEALGGVARKTREAVILCEAAGFDVIIIETVGVGQSETAVHGMTDFFLLLQLSGAGDELQGIKRGIMEMADGILINKADGDNVRKAQLARTTLVRALHLFPRKESDWQPEVATCSALKKDGISDVWSMIERYVATTTENGFFEARRREQALFWMRETIRTELGRHFAEDPKVQALIDAMETGVLNRQTTPFRAARELLASYFGTHSS